MAHPAVWAIVINNFSFHYAFYVIMNWLPTYFNRWDVDGGQIGQQWKRYTRCLWIFVLFWCLTWNCLSGADEPIPTHLYILPRSVLKVELSSLGGMKTLPYIVMFLMSNVGGLMGDWLIMQRKMSVGAGRKAVNTMGEREVS